MGALGRGVKLASLWLLPLSVSLSDWDSSGVGERRGVVPGRIMMASEWQSGREMLSLFRAATHDADDQAYFACFIASYGYSSTTATCSAQTAIR